MKSEIVFGTDDKGIKGYQINYQLKKEYAKGGGVAKKSKYLSRRNIKSIETKSGVTIKAKDIIDGAYVTKSIKFEHGGAAMQMPEVSGFSIVYQKWDAPVGGKQGTIRTYPSNYWVASILDDGSIVFDSWEGMTKIIDKAKVRVLWESGNIPQEQSAMSKLNQSK